MKQTRDEISKRLMKIIIDKLGVDEKEVTEEASFTNDLGADSLDVTEIIMEVENEFREEGLIIPSQDEEKITTFGELLDYIYENQDEE